MLFLGGTLSIALPRGSAALGVVSSGAELAAPASSCLSCSCFTLISLVGCRIGGPCGADFAGAYLLPAGSVILFRPCGVSGGVEAFAATLDAGTLPSLIQGGGFFAAGFSPLACNASSVVGGGGGGVDARSPLGAFSGNLFAAGGGPFGPGGGPFGIGLPEGLLEVSPAVLAGEAVLALARPVPFPVISGFFLSAFSMISSCSWLKRSN